jgi:hypothetical protein
MLSAASARAIASAGGGRASDRDRADSGLRPGADRPSLPNGWTPTPPAIAADVDVADGRAGATCAIVSSMRD